MTFPAINIINRKKVQACGYVAEKLVWIVRKVILEIPEWNFRNETICRLAIYEKETPTQVFPVNTTKFFKDTYVEEYLQMAASAGYGAKYWPSCPKTNSF